MLFLSVMLNFSLMTSSGRMLNFPKHVWSLPSCSECEEQSFSFEMSGRCHHAAECDVELLPDESFSMSGRCHHAVPECENFSLMRSFTDVQSLPHAVQCDVELLPDEFVLQL